MEEHLFNIEPGMLIDLSYFTAGMAAVGIFQGLTLATSLNENRSSYLVFAILCFFTSLIQVLAAQYHVSSSLKEAIFYQKALNTTVFIFFPFLFSWVSLYTEKKYHAGLTIIISIICLIIIVINIQSDYGLRFAQIPKVDFVEFSWGEKLLVLRGDPSDIVIPVRIAVAVFFGWIFFCGYRMIKINNKLSGYAFIVGGLSLILVSIVSGNVDHKQLDFIYIGGYGFLAFIAMISVVLAKEFQQSRDRVNTLELYDSLTSLPNRDLLINMLEKEIDAMKSTHQYFSLLLLDIDRFKSLISAKGHKFGDDLLLSFSKQLSSKLGPKDILARLSADQFAILLQEKGNTRQEINNKSYSLAERLQNELRESCVVDNNEAIVLGFSVGIVNGSSEKQTSHDLLQNVDTALQRAKQAGGGAIEFFDPDVGNNVVQRFQLESQLRKAIEKNELRLFLQPQVNKNRKIVGSEALIRWQHPEKGLVPPGVFIDLAEESDLIIDISKWVFDQVCRILSHENVMGNPIHISVNVSPRHFSDKDFVSWVKEVIARNGTDPSQMTLEITEGLMLQNIDDVVLKMNALNDLGVHFSIDDFGTGYSSLSYLKKLPIHELKIDKSFVQDAHRNLKDAALIETIISIASHMSLKIVAEGVETQEQADYLNNLAPLIHQGYLYGKPEHYENWTRRWSGK